MYFDYMFSYDKKWIGQRIGEYVSHILIKNLSVDEINELDRIISAQRWYSYEDYYHKKKIDEILDKYGVHINDFLIEVAEWMDSRIPQAYKKNYLKDADHGPASQSIKVDNDGIAEFGLIYHYKKNRHSIIIEHTKPTQNQLDYLISLAYKHNYSIINTDFSRIEASRFINYFKEYGYEETPPSFDKYFMKGL